MKRTTKLILIVAELVVVLALPYSIQAAPARYSWYTSGSLSITDTTIASQIALLDDSLAYMRAILGFGGEGVDYMKNNYPDIVLTRYAAKSWFQLVSAAFPSIADIWYYKAAGAQYYTWDLMLALAEPDSQFYEVGDGQIDDWRFNGFGRMAHGGREKILFEGVIQDDGGNPVDYTESAYANTATITIDNNDTLYFRDLGPWHAMSCSVTVAGVRGGGQFAVFYIDTAGDWTAVAAATRDICELMFTNTGNTERTFNPPPPLTGADAWGYMNDTAIALMMIFSGWDSYPTIKGAHRFEYADRYDAALGLKDSVAFLGWEPLSDTDGDGWRDTGSYAMCAYYATPTTGTSNGRRFSGYFKIKAETARDSLGHQIYASMIGDFITEDSQPFGGVAFNQPPVRRPFDDAGSDLQFNRSIDYEGISTDSAETAVWSDNVSYSLPILRDTIQARSDSVWVAVTVSETWGISTPFTCYGSNTWWRWGLRGRDMMNCALATDTIEQKNAVDMLFIESSMKSLNTGNYYGGGVELRHMQFLWEAIAANQRVLAMYEFTSAASTSVGTKMGESAGDTLVVTTKIFYPDSAVRVGDTILFGVQTAGGADTILNTGSKTAIDNSASIYCSPVPRQIMRHFFAASYWLLRPGNTYDSAFDDRFHVGMYAGVTGNRPECNAFSGDSRANGWSVLFGPDFDLGEPINAEDFDTATYSRVRTAYPWTVFDTGQTLANPVNGDIYSRQHLNGTDTNLVLWRVYGDRDAYKYDSTGGTAYDLGGWYQRVVENDANGDLDTLVADTLVTLFDCDGAFLLAAEEPSSGTPTNYQINSSGVKIGMKDEKRTDESILAGLPVPAIGISGWRHNLGR